MQKVRMIFTKTGLARYISHLDMMRCMTRAMKRAKIDVKYTQGFNPIPYLVFGNPLSLGYQSKAEICDFSVNDDMPYEEIKQRLSMQMPEGIVITSLDAPVMDFKQIGYARYTLEVENENPFDEIALEKVVELFKAEKLEIMKKSKSGEKLTDIMPLIKGFEATLDNCKIVIDVVVPFNNQQSLNPEHIVKAIAQKTDILDENFYVSYIKTKTLNYDLEKFK